MPSGRSRSLLSTLLVATLWPVAVLAGPAAPLDRSSFKPTFAAEFDGPLDLWSPANPRGTWKSDYYFGPQRDRRSAPTTPAEQFMARTLPGELQVYVDPAYCGHDPFSVSQGVLSIRAEPLPDQVLFDCGRGTRRWASGLITTEKSLRQTYGYFEARVKMPGAWGTWPAFWLLPTEKTAENAGRLPEIDVFEHYSGPHPTVQVKPGVPLDRTGLANIAVHLGRTGAEQVLHPQVQPKTTTTSEFHTYGVLWTASELVFYLDDRETWRTPFQYAKPMYMLLNLAISDKTAGDPALGTYPAALEIDYVRAWTAF